MFARAVFSSAERSAHSVAFVVWVASLAALTGGSTCAPPPVVDECPALNDLCPNLRCVSFEKNDAGCAICECAVQACLVNSECSNDDFCDLSPNVCEPAPGCTDDDDGTACPAACFGRCTTPGAPSATGLCFSDDDCAAGGCRKDERICVRDVNNPQSSACHGWCVDVCDDVLTIAADPFTRQCVEFFDSCIPPGFIEGC